MCYFRTSDLRGSRFGMKYTSCPTLLYVIWKAAKQTSWCTIEDLPKGQYQYINSIPLDLSVPLVTNPPELIIIYSMLNVTSLASGHLQDPLLCLCREIRTQKKGTYLQKTLTGVENATSSVVCLCFRGESYLSFQKTTLCIVQAGKPFDLIILNFFPPG